MSQRIALIIVTYNGERYSDALFESLAHDTFPKDRLGIFVVDNASTDDTIQRIANYGLRIPNLRVIHNLENEGFARGNNIAIRRALEEGYDWTALLNQDTVVNLGMTSTSSVNRDYSLSEAQRSRRASFAASWLTECLRVGESDPRIAAVQPLLALWPPEKNEINSLGNEIHFLGFGFSKSYHEKITSYESRVTSPSEIVYASGAAVLLRASALRDIGLFNDDFFMYHEDLDLGWRLWLRNWKSVLAPNAVVYHKYDFRAAAYKYYYMERNRLIVLLRNYKFPTLVLICPALLLMELGLFGFSIFNGWWKEKLRGYWWVFTHLKLIFKTRTKIQKNRTVSDRQITRRFVSTISYQEIENPILRYLANPFFKLFWSIARSLIFW